MMILPFCNRWTLLGDTRSSFQSIKDGMHKLKDWSTNTYGDHEMKIHKVITTLKV